MKLLLSRDFPHSPPKGYFLTKIFHPNIATNGEICVNTLKKDWNPSLGLRHVLIVVRCLLIEPFPESTLNEQAGKMLLENYDEYARHARLYIGIHAKPKPKFKSGAICESTTTLYVEQRHNSVLNVEQKNAASGVGLLLNDPEGSAISQTGVEFGELGPLYEKTSRFSPSSQWSYQKSVSRPSQIFQMNPECRKTLEETWRTRSRGSNLADSAQLGESTRFSDSSLPAVRGGASELRLGRFWRRWIPLVEPSIFPARSDTTF
ncbi:ubiquitin-conjugating enzyme E2 22-like [Hibiscus syriacus]|uniref:ubiquitin-conjugating enzyme E2 22-like n=1 Tax=Hibiscus syriacus TaxID=106335 RepID=UPI0019238AFD|nr:ubiquitin-conjugating enzyme E2 22-like [Hibiscus syriacus]